MKKRSLHIMLLFIAAATLQTTTSAWGMKRRRNPATFSSSSSSSASAAATRETITEEEVVQSWRNDIQLAIQVRNEALHSVAEQLALPLRTAIDARNLETVLAELERAVQHCNILEKWTMYARAIDYALEKETKEENFAGHVFYRTTKSHQLQIIRQGGKDRLLHLMKAALKDTNCYDWIRDFGIAFLEKAIQEENRDALYFLIEKVDLSTPDEDNTLPLTLAVKTGNVGNTRILLEYHAARGHKRQPHEATAAAIISDNKDMLRLLLEYPNEQKYVLERANLFPAVAHFAQQCVPHTENKFKYELEDLLSLISRREPSSKLTHAAASSSSSGGEPPCKGRLYDPPAYYERQVEERNGQFFDPLLLNSVKSDSIDGVSHALAFNADPFAKDDTGKTAFDLVQSEQVREYFVCVIAKRMETLALCLEPQAKEDGAPIAEGTDPHLIDHISERVNFYLQQ